MNGAPKSQRTLRISAAIGALAWLAMRFVPTENGTDTISRAVLLGAIVVTPLALALLPASGPGWARWHALVAIAQPIGAVAVIASFAFPTGPIAGALASVWMSVALVVASLGAVRLAAIVRARKLPDAAELGFAVGPALLSVGAAWFVASRMGVRVLGFDPVMVLLTAAHFHFIGIAMPILLACSVARAPSAGSRRALSIALVTFLAAIPLVAIGITASPVVALVGAVLIAGALLAHASIALLQILPRLHGLPAKLVFAVSLLSPLLSMPLAVLWSVSVVAPQLALPVPLDLDWMLRLHGQANAHGVVTMGLLAWTLDARRAKA